MQLKMPTGAEHFYWRSGFQVTICFYAHHHAQIYKLKLGTGIKD